MSDVLLLSGNINRWTAMRKNFGAADDPGRNQIERGFWDLDLTPAEIANQVERMPKIDGQVYYAATPRPDRRRSGLG